MKKLEHLHAVPAETKPHKFYDPNRLSYRHIIIFSLYIRYKSRSRGLCVAMHYMMFLNLW
jgi:hypothetical protein